ncbi:MAG: HAD family phosphatase [Anaerolineae bacterium]|nr:HAD family phosphatase [Anaerolineae bacterium]NUQ03960.1 HAD family phosphatase [Anaerolineae bacterium]
MRPINFCPRAVIFDMDGLLVNSEHVWEVVEGDMLIARNVQLNQAIRAQFIGMRMGDFWRGMHASFHLAEPVEDLIAEAVQGMVERVGAEAEPQPGALALIDFVVARRIPCAIASSSPMPIIEAVVGAHGWGEVFALRVCGDDVQHGKPAPDIYLETARRLGVPPQACLALEDSVNGARAAVAAGMITIAVPDAAHTTAEAFRGVTDHVYPTLHEVRAALEECDFAAL